MLTFQHPSRHTRNSLAHIIIDWHVDWIVITEFRTASDLCEYLGYLSKVRPSRYINSVRHNVTRLRRAIMRGDQYREE
jgi:hypothetical protein